MATSSSTAPFSLDLYHNGLNNIKSDADFTVFVENWQSNEDRMAQLYVDHRNADLGEYIDEDMPIMDEDEIVYDPNKRDYHIHDPNIHWKLKKPILGELMATWIRVFNEEEICLTCYSVANGYQLWYEKSDSEKLLVRCGFDEKERKKKKLPRDPNKPCCPFRLRAVKRQDGNSWHIRTLVYEHTCTRQYYLGCLMTSKWIARQYEDKIRMNPDLKVVDLQEMVMKKYRVKTSYNQCSRARRIALYNLKQNVGSQYDRLVDYAGELRKTNHGTTMHLCIDPLADVESTESWEWFIKSLTKDLGLADGHGITFILDGHKGLIQAVRRVVPRVEHRLFKSASKNQPLLISDWAFDEGTNMDASIKCVHRTVFEIESREGFPRVTMKLEQIPASAQVPEMGMIEDKLHSEDISVTQRNAELHRSSLEDMEREIMYIMSLKLRAMDYDQLYSEFNVGAARQVCLGAEVRMRAEHTLEKKGKLENRCAEQTVLLSERDAEITHLKSLLSLKEAEAAEAISLRGQLSVVEAADDAKGTKLRDLKEKNFALEGEKNSLSDRVEALESAAASKEVEMASLSFQVSNLSADLSGFRLSRDELNSKVAYLESKRDCLAAQKGSLESAVELFKEQVEKMHDEQMGVLSECIAAIDFDLMEMALHKDFEFYPRFLTTIAGRRWILSRGLNLVLTKCLSSPEYLSAMGEAIGRAIDKGMQDGLAVGIEHGTAIRSFTDVAAFNPSAENDYVAAINTL
ncbi:hypothetical protein Tco_0352520 [Tanacetum coccineum]